MWAATANKRGHLGSIMAADCNVEMTNHLHASKLIKLLDWWSAVKAALYHRETKIQWIYVAHQSSCLLFFLHVWLHFVCIPGFEHKICFWEIALVLEGWILITFHKACSEFANAISHMQNHERYLGSVMDCSYKETVTPKRLFYYFLWGCAKWKISKSIWRW